MSNVFDAYSEYYDLLYADKDYAREAEYVAALIKLKNSKATTILDLGCGTGAHAEQLAKLGFIVHGIDLAAGMLKKAEQRRLALAEDIASRLSFSMGDVRTVSLGKTFDVVVSLFHVMSYQNSNQSIEDTLCTASSHLADRGIFIFDYWYGPAVITDKPQIRIKRMENEKIKVLRIAEPVMKVLMNVVEVNYTVLVEEKKSGEITQLAEEHSMRYFFLPEIEQFSQLQFRQPKNLNWLSMEDPPSDRSWSALSILVKK